MWTRRILERLQAIQNQQGSTMCDEFRQSLALLPSRPDPWIAIAKPSESRLKKFICGRTAPTASLSVKRPAENKLRRAILFSRHPSEPVINERRLPNTRPGNDCNDIYVSVGPGSIQESDILLSTKNIASRNGQSRYGNFLRSQSCWRPASSETQISRGRLLQAQASDSTPRVDSAC